MRLLGTIVFLLMAAAGCWKAAERPVLLVLLLGGFGAAAMMCPAAYVPIASGGVLGAISAWLAVDSSAGSAAGDRDDDGQAARPSSRRPAARFPGRAAWHIAVLGVLPALLVEPRGAGRDPAGACRRGRRRSRPPRRRCTACSCPSTKKKPTGGKVYVPEPFYQELYRRTTAAAEKSPGWLIQPRDLSRRLGRRARLRTPGGGHLAGAVRFAGVRAGHAACEFRFAPRARTCCPTASCSTAGRSSRNGSRMRPRWRSRWPSRASTAWRYRCGRRCATPAGRRASTWRCPAWPRSRLELTLPDGAPPVEVPSACGAVRVEKDPPRLLADLGPAERLTVRWQEGAASARSEPAVDAEQLVWLKVQPGSVVIATKFKLHVGEGQIQQVQLAVDPRLRLLPLPGDDPPTVQVGAGIEPIPADRLPLVAPRLGPGHAGSHVPARAAPRAWAISACRGSNCSDARTTKRWMAMSVDPALDREEQQKQRLEAVAGRRFLEGLGRGRGESRRRPTACPPAKPTGPFRPGRTSRAARSTRR